MASHLLDTNVLLRYLVIEAPEHPVVAGAVSRLETRGASFAITTQNVVEMWSVVTRPTVGNGWGFSIAVADDYVRDALESFELLEDDSTFFFRWRGLVNAHQVSGKQVHDARLVAVMRTYRVPGILTLNPSDFVRYSGIQVVHPARV